MVLVILAILAAIMVPALTGWIDKAKEKQIVINARTAYLAAQTIASERYAKGKKGDTITITEDEIKTFVADGSLADSNITGISVDPDTGKVDGMTYEEGGKEVHYTESGWDFLS